MSNYKFKTTKQRRIIHEVAELMGLSHFSDGDRGRVSASAPACMGTAAGSSDATLPT
jgi:hypothetical protein